MAHFGGRTRCSRTRTSPFYIDETEPASAAEPPSHEAIARLAYSYWEARDRRGGSAEEDWLRAVEELTRAR